MLTTVKEYLAKQAMKPSGIFGRQVMTRLFNKKNQEMEQQSFQRMQPGPNDQILEIGFGSGRFISDLLSRISDGKVCGIDISEDMIQTATKRNQKWIGKGKLELKKASIAEIPYPDEIFDKVFTCNTIYFWPDPAANLREVRRVLKPGGNFYCALRPKSYMESIGPIRDNQQIYRNLYQKEEIVPLFEEADFQPVSLEIESISILLVKATKNA